MNNTSHNHHIHTQNQSHPLIGNAQDFIARTAQGPFVMRQQVDPETIFQWSDLETLVNDTAMPRNLAIDGHKQAGVSLDQVRQGLARGATLQLETITTLCPRARDVAIALSQCLSGEAVDANMYLSPTPKHIAFDTHFDMFDFLVVQIYGEKRWRVYEPSIPDPIFGMKRPSYKENPPAIVMDLILKPGDVLYIRRGDPHDAVVVGDEASLHLNFRFCGRLTGQDFARWVTDRVLMRANARKAWPFVLKEPATDTARVAWVQILVQEFEQVLKTDAHTLLQEFSVSAPSMQTQATRVRFPEAITYSESSPK